MLGYARDARGGRIDSAALQPKSRSGARAAQSHGGDRVDRHPLGPRRLFAELPARPAAIRGSPAEADRSSAAASPSPSRRRAASPTARRSSSASTHEQVALLRKRLDIPVEDGGTETMFDASVHAPCSASRRPMARCPTAWSAPARGACSIGSSTTQAASPAQDQADPLNMERWRWLPHDLGAFYVNVNIPEFMVRVMEDGKPVHTTRVVVGKPDKQTPIISNEMQEIVFNPYLEHAELDQDRGDQALSPRGRRLVRRRRLEHCRVSSATICASISAAGRSTPPGSTGTASISAPSTSISRRDPTTCSATSNSCSPTSTTSTCTTRTQKSLFAKTVRAESHGCMRVQNPDQLAADPAEAGPGLERRRGSPRPSRAATTSILRCGRRFRSTSPTSPSG